LSLSCWSIATLGALAWGCAAKNGSDSTFTGSRSSATTGGPTTSGAGGASATTTTGGAGMMTTTGASTTTGQIMTTGTTGAGTGGSGINPDAACASTKEGTTQIPTDVFIMQDHSGSMQCLATDDACQNTPGTPSRWDEVSKAINTFVNSPGPAMAGIGVGIGFFPVNMGGIIPLPSCTATDYAKPAVQIAPLPGNATPIANAITMTMPSGGTPTYPALQGALDYARSYNMQNMGKRTAAVLLVTDGVPSGCGLTNAIPDISTLAQQAYEGMPQIKTFVVGMGDTAALDQVALAGSGGMTHYIPAMGDVVGALSKALVAITGMISCTYTIPATAVDPQSVNIQITTGGMTKDIGKVANAAACGTPGGWYYDNEMKPTMIILCPGTCDAARMDTNANVQVLYGCPSMPPR
jgi:hypothetical protein